MFKTIKSLFFTALVVTSSHATASNFFAHLYTRFEAGQCLMFSWIEIDGARRKVVFPGQTTEEDGVFHCAVNIAAQDFEQFFANCFLTGLVFSGDGKQSKNTHDGYTPGMRRDAFLAGRMPQRFYAEATSSLGGRIETRG